MLYSVNHVKVSPHRKPLLYLLCLHYDKLHERVIMSMVDDVVRKDRIMTPDIQEYLS